MRSTSGHFSKVLALLALAPAIGFAQTAPPDSGVSTRSRLWDTTRAHYIVQAHTAQAARESVVRVGGGVDQELAVINAVSADLNANQADELRSMSDVRLFSDRRLAPLGGGKGPSGPPSGPAPPLHGSVTQALTDGSVVSMQANKFVTN